MAECKLSTLILVQSNFHRGIPLHSRLEIRRVLIC